jgi:threonylcarbamoyladenosine tRNA methylthiotransferase MtaB
MEYRGGSTVALETLGCKLNQAETELLAGKLTAAGYHLVAPRQGADIYVLNTCTVTHIADRKSRHLLRWARRTNPKSLVIAIGCYAQRAPQELADLPGVNLVLGNEEKWRLVGVLQAAGVSRQMPRVLGREPGGAGWRIQPACRSGSG